MTAGIEATDRPVYHAKAAWHGLGIVVENAPSPDEARVLAKLDWDPMEAPITGIIEPPGGKPFRKPFPTHKAIIRDDNHSLLGIVTSKYKPVKNRELVEFIYELADSSNVKVESAGSIHNGKRVWFLLKAPTMFDLPGDDKVAPYVLVSNGHDGGTSLYVQATTIRVVCNNTLGFATYSAEDEVQRGMAVAYRHSGSIMDRIGDAKEALKYALTDLEEFKEIAQEMAETKMTEEQMKEFFLEVYAETWGMPPTNPTNKKEEAARKRAEVKIAKWIVNASEGAGADLKSSKGTVWGALNALTLWSDHERQTKNVEDVFGRTNSKLFGSGADFKTTALLKAQELLNA